MTAQEAEPRCCVIDKDLEGAEETESGRDVRRAQRHDVEMVDVETRECRSRSDCVPTVFVFRDGSVGVRLELHSACHSTPTSIVLWPLALAVTYCSLGDHSTGHSNDEASTHEFEPKNITMDRKW